MSVARDELESVGYLYTRYGPLGCQYGKEWAISQDLVEYSADAIAYFFIALLLTVLQLMSLSTLPSPHAEDAEERMLAYWSIQKYISIIAVGSLLAGLYNCAMSTIYLYTIKFPDLGAADFCASLGWAVQNENDTFQWGPKYGWPEGFAGAEGCTFGDIDKTYLHEIMAGETATYQGCTDELGYGVVYKFVQGTVRVFGDGFALEDAIDSHACSFEANMR
jgi:hypothetical protein